MGNRKPSSLKTETYDSILKDIIEGNYKQNEIIDEKWLIGKYGAGKSPIRDVLIESCNEEALISHPRYEYEMVRINEREMRGIVNLWIMVGTGCFRDAASIMTRGDIMELREFTLTEYSDKDKDLAVLKHWDNNSKFHLRLPSYSGNEYYYSMLQESIGTMMGACTQRHWEKRGITSICMGCKNHLKVIDYLMDKDLKWAADEPHRDIMSFLDILYPNYGSHMYM